MHKHRCLTTGKESFDVLVGEMDSRVAIWKLVLPSAIAKYNCATAIQIDLLHFPIWVGKLLHSRPGRRSVMFSSLPALLGNRLWQHLWIAVSIL